MIEGLTAYCGLCCIDCIPSREEFFKLVNDFDEVLGELKFEHYAELKSEVVEEFKEYPKFLSILCQIKSLHCSSPCQSRGGNPQCKIRQCAQSKDLKGCWQCKDRQECTLLDRLWGIHPNVDYYLDLIEEMKPVNWFKKRKEHYQWQVDAKQTHSSRPRRRRGR
jgi:hypothetical protein